MVRDYFRPKRSLGIFDVIPGLGGQEAYRLKRSSAIMAPMSLPFQQGRPHQFSFECTFRAPRQPQEPYDLMKMTNSLDNEVANININPMDRSLTCDLPNMGPNGPQKVKFQDPPVSFAEYLLLVRCFALNVNHRRNAEKSKVALFSTRLLLHFDLIVDLRQPVAQTLVWNYTN